MSVRSSLDDDDELLAAELAFGLLAEAERVMAEQRAERDEAFAAGLRRWRDYAVSLATDNGSVSPPTAVWSQIEARLPDRAADWRGRRATLRKRPIIAALAAAAAVFAIGVAVGERLASPPPVAASPTPLVAVLNGSENAAVLTVTVDAPSNRIIVAPSRLRVGAHSAQLWAIPASGKPVSLGLVVTSRPAVLNLLSTNRAALRPGASIAVSVEPTGGSPTGQPTGPVILIGKLATS